MMEWIINHINTFFSECWIWFMALFYWVTCIGSVILLSIYATTKSRKPLNIMGALIVLWIFLEGMSLLR